MKKLTIFFIEYASIIFAAILYAAAIKYFIFPSQIILTGTEGIAISISYYFEKNDLFIILYLFFQLLLLSFSFFKISKKFTLRTFILVASVALFLFFLPTLTIAKPEPENERLFLVIFGAILMGVAKAIALKCKGSTGDEDILGAYFAQKYLKPVGTIGIYAAIISTSFGLILMYLKTGKPETAINTLMYTSLYIFICANTVNNLFRKYRLTQLTIISETPDKIIHLIMNTFIKRTYTMEEALGGYKKNKQFVIKIILTHEELPAARNLLKSIEKDCFFYYYDIEGVTRNYKIDPIG